MMKQQTHQIPKTASPFAWRQHQPGLRLESWLHRLYFQPKKVHGRYEWAGMRVDWAWKVSGWQRT